MIKDPQPLDAGIWRQILPEELTQGKSLKIVDLRYLHDESGGALGSHTRWHPGIISQLLASRAGRFFFNDEYKCVTKLPAPPTTSSNSRGSWMWGALRPT